MLNICWQWKALATNETVIEYKKAAYRLQVTNVMAHGLHGKHEERKKERKQIKGWLLGED